MENKNYKETQIAQLERDIRITQDILDGKIENYTQHPFHVLSEGLIDFQNKLKKLKQETAAERGCFKGVYMRA